MIRVLSLLTHSPYESFSIESPVELSPELVHEQTLHTVLLDPMASVDMEYKNFLGVDFHDCRKQTVNDLANLLPAFVVNLNDVFVEHVILSLKESPGVLTVSLCKGNVDVSLLIHGIKWRVLIVCKVAVKLAS